MVRIKIERDRIQNLRIRVGFRKVKTEIRTQDFTALVDLKFGTSRLIHLLVD